MTSTDIGGWLLVISYLIHGLHKLYAARKATKILFILQMVIAPQPLAARGIVMTMIEGRWAAGSVWQESLVLSSS